MATLVIVGNGFDIQNRLPTSYWYFYKKYNERLDDHFIHFPNFFDDQEWSNFEENLGLFDEDNFREGAAWEPSMDDMIESSKYVNGYNDEISQKTNELVDDIRSVFIAWIKGIDVKQAIKFMDFPKGFKFINFNYTSTLQDVYSVPDEDVLHIHGKARWNVIFGHGIGNSNQSRSMEPNQDEPWFEESFQTLTSVIDKFHKPVNEILEKHRKNLESYGDVTKIIVLGHSINSIDIPYFKCILEAYPDALWRNWNHRSEEIDGVSDTHDKLLSLGVPSDKLLSLSSKNLGRAYPTS
ncbi:bacteriophage abortive infection AbiH family protein [Pseudoalteromonas sp. SWXJZ94C]|uniref:AbiH family protein n=1 Tax=Pseudoalteromonas sp. SWXJZ94C TaxID=2792065 RepID=UPI0018CF6E39|nr:AbiH family protein [Pseudoalteromonas sp. SWXJZ94C]MBH0059158.1 bacteriophage abortive infection AbiH family protein [Pseudoalteromonas sp. SWXJZ94C]